MTDDSKPTLDYADDPASLRRRKIVRQLAAVIVLKLVMVAVNIGMAFSDIGTTPRLIGIGIQVGLTGVFLVLLFKLISVERPEK